MNFSLIYITIIRLGLYVRMYKYIVQHNFNSSPSHPHSPRWQIYKNPKIERKKHKENKNMDITNEWFVFFARAIFFLLRGIVCIDIVESGKKIETIIAAVANWMWLRCLFVVPIPFAWSNLETMRFFGLATTCYCVVILWDHAQFLAMTCKCINELGTYL